MSGQVSASVASISKSSDSPTFEKKGRLNDIEKESLNSSSERGYWSNRTEFVLSCIGTAVGLGNIWRFPYLTYKNGGGAFVVAYIIMMVLVGLPLLIVEMSIGQFSALGPGHVYGAIAPIFKGLGYAIIVGAVIVNSYYIVVMSWSLFYIYESFAGQKWKRCDNHFNTYKCKPLSESAEGNFVSRDHKSPAEEFFNNHILMKSSSMDDLSVLSTPLVVCLFLSWVIVAAALVKGIKSSGKVVYFTATFPYLVLAILFIRACFLDGAWQGMKFFLVPDWEQITSPEHMARRCNTGVLQLESSQRRNANIFIVQQVQRTYRAVDLLTSLLAGVVVFAMLGFMGHSLNKPIDDVISGGFGLIFIAIPEGLSQMPGSILWNLLYFFMLFLLGIGTLFSTTEALMTFIFDTMRSYGLTVLKPPMVIAVCVCMFFLGMPFCTPSGVYFLELLDHYIGFPFLIFGIMESTLIAYVYGVRNFLRDVTLMTNWRPSFWTRSQLMVRLSTSTPLFLGILVVKEMIDLVSPDIPLKSGDLVYSALSKSLGWLVSLIPVMVMTVMAPFYIVSGHRDSTVSARLKLGFTPTALYYKNAKKHVVMEETSR
ncbi:Sodium- and chloride-dependent glycine transporter 2 [Halotydeus destructor]|nr:Sodium- and chloride-dependent glycine transporter 2 [Halotydeus destructor]